MGQFSCTLSTCFGKKNAHIILERNKALLRESVGVVIKVAVLYIAQSTRM